MEEELISLETAMLAKEKGFNIPTQKAYINGSVFVNFEESFGKREFYFDADDFYNDWNRKGWFFDKKGRVMFGSYYENLCDYHCKDLMSKLQELIIIRQKGKL